MVRISRRVLLFAGAGLFLCGCEVPNPAYDITTSADSAADSALPDVFVDGRAEAPDVRRAADVSPQADAPTPADTNGETGAEPDAAFDASPSDGLLSLSQGLVAHVAADEGTARTLADKAGGPALIARPPFSWVPGRSGTSNSHAISFDDGGWASTAPSEASPRVLAARSAMSVAVWINWSVPREGDSALSGLAGNVWYFRVGTASFRRLCISITTDAGMGQACNSTDIPLNQWTHVAFTWDGATIALFVNGREDQLPRRQLTGSVRSYPSNKELPLGALPGGGDTFIGALSDFRMYERALTPSEVAALAR